MAHPRVAMFARLADGSAVPRRQVAGQLTRLTRTMHDIRYNEVHDEFVVANLFSQAILTFRGGAAGEEPPIRVIQGPKTGITMPLRFDVDTVHDEIVLPDGPTESILVFDRAANGDVAPLRVIRGPDTGLDGVGTIAVDPVNDLIIARARQDGQPALLLFNRTDQGNVKPRAVIAGPKTGMNSITQLQAYPPRGWIIGVQMGAGEDEMNRKDSGVVAFSIRDSGNVAPRWTLGGPRTSIRRVRGVALNPANKEIMVAEMRRNAVLTFHYPEIF